MSRGRYISNGAHLLPDDPYDLPDSPPPHPSGEEWSRHALLVWESIRRSPSRAAFVEADVPAILSLLTVEDRIAKEGMSAALSAEARRHRDALGLTPHARLRLGIRADETPPTKRELDVVPLRPVSEEDKEALEAIGW